MIVARVRHKAKKIKNKTYINGVRSELDKRRTRFTQEQ